ncbi:TVP38/TMEM64 family protein [Stappia sp. MMSF_3263]|uniref:TVP38/TMEM64 family protein n=1 Tax=Stappia sp. MMSF_3263 TaxID=3046693 RepID=UPI00273F16A5|nr:VTT domain-containing protein [Stappia sp. MMSF_3263]
MPQREEGDAHAPPPAGRSVLRRFAPLALIVAAMGLGYALGLHHYLGLSHLIRERMELAAFVSDNMPLAVAVFVVVYVVAVALSFPGASLLTIIGGFLFGWALGGTLVAFAATAGAALIFLAARSSLGEALKHRAGPFLSRLAAGFREDAFNYLLFLRLAPVFPFWLVNIAPALFGMSLRPYVTATFIGILPGTYAYAFIGAGLDSVIAAQESASPGCAAAGTCSIELSALVTRDLVLAFAALGIAALIPVLVRKLRAKSRLPRE